MAWKPSLFTITQVLLVPALALPTSIEIQTWEKLAFEADLVGVIECVQAGEIVARFRIVESWKKPAVASTRYSRSGRIGGRT